MNPRRWVVGIDIGGTFTDLIMFNTDDATVRLAEVPTTMHNPQRVAQDVARGYYTPAQAEALFAVGLSVDGSVDSKRTADLRRRS